MDTDFRVTGKNTAAPFSLTIHRGDGMVLLGMNWKAGRPPANFAGFAIQYREPGTQFFKTVHNRIGFPGQPYPTTASALPRPRSRSSAGSISRLALISRVPSSTASRRCSWTPPAR